MVKPVSVHITTMDAELEFSIHPSTTGKQLFDQVVKTIGLREIWFFGLQYKDTKGFTTWLKLATKVTAQEVKKDSGTLRFRFLIKFVPEDVGGELIQEATQRLFFLQLKYQILSEELYCPPETCLLLAAYALQVKHGDLKADLQEDGFLSKERLLPERVFQQHQMSKEQWEERIMLLWGEQIGMLREDAMMEYLKIVQDLEMYGVNYFEMKNKRGTELYLGVDALGLSIYERDDKLTPKIGFPWSEIRNISFDDKKFSIKPIDKKAPDFMFIVPRLRVNKRILSLCMGNHELYMRRRKPDSIEVQQMKEEAREEKANKQSEKQQMAKEKQLRADAEKEKLALEARLRIIEEDARKAQQILDEAQQGTEELSRQKSEAENESAKALDLKAVVDEEKKNLLQKLHEGAIKRHDYEELVRAANEESEKRRIYAEQVQEKADRLQAQLLESQLREEEQKHELIKIISTPPPAVAMIGSARGVDLTACEFEEESGVYEARDLGTSDVTQLGLEDISQPDKTLRLQQQLYELSSELNQARDEAKMTTEDILHEGNLRDGRDKYKTLRQIRSGNTKQRVDEFEAL